MHFTALFSFFALWILSANLWAEDPPASPGDDPYVMKIYPDGSKTVMRWSEIGGNLDQGENHGGPPRFVAWDGSKSSFSKVTSAKQPASTRPDESPVSVSSPTTSTPPKPSSPGSNPPMREMNYPDTTVQPWDQQREDRANNTRITLVEEYDPDEVYGRLQVGPSFVRSQSINSINGLPTSSQLSFDTGLRGSFEIGGHLSRYLSLEGNVGGIWNSSQQSSDGWLLQIPIMIGLNGEFPIPVEDGPRLIPYLGVDAGGSFMLYNNLEFTPAGQTALYDDSFGFFTPVWQVRVGIMVEFRDNWAFTAGYSYLGSWGAIGEPVSTSNIQLGSIGTSSIDIGLRTFF